VRRQAVGQDRRGLFQRHGAFDDVFELADVARPVVAASRRPASPEIVSIDLPSLTVLRQEVVGDERDVFAADRAAAAVNRE
jgi:hypothetical protein